MKASGARSFLLAAGSGRRAGGPKAWLEHGGEPLLERHVRFLRGWLAGADVFVSIQPGWRQRCARLDPSVQWVGVDPRSPPLEALQALARRAGGSRAAFVHHVDMPLWDKDVFDRLALALGSREAAVPAHAGRRGHPVLLGPSAVGGLLALDPARDRLDRWLRGGGVVQVEVPHALIHENWNERVPS